jgi:hypothetical protein
MMRNKCFKIIIKRKFLMVELFDIEGRLIPRYVVIDRDSYLDESDVGLRRKRFVLKIRNIKSGAKI